MTHALSVAIVSTHPQTAQIQSAILKAANISKVTRYSGLAMFQSEVQRQVYDLVIVNDLAYLNTAIASQIVRDRRHSKNPCTMTLLVTSNTRRCEVRAAIGQGYDDLLIMPFSPESLYDKLKGMADCHRRFVATATYFGPDRRRADTGPPEGVEERRRSVHNVKRTRLRQAN